MVLDVVLAAVGALGLVIAAMSARLRRMPLSEPMLALALGVVLGPAMLDVLRLEPVTSDHQTFHDGARMLLAVSVMGVALRYPFSDARRRLGQVVLLLLVAMPVMALVSTGLALGILGLPLTAALLLGTALSPTDPVLASSVVTGKPAEEDLPARDREILSLESGSNDGLALPLVLVAVAIAGPMTGTAALGDIAWQVLGALVLGAVVGWVAGRAIRLGEEHGATSRGPMLLFTLVLAFAVLGLSGTLHVDGILAVLVTGLAFNLVSSGNDRTAELEIDEAVNRFAVIPLFLMLGAALPWAEWGRLGWGGVGLAVAVLVLRRLPVLLLLKKPLRLGWADAAYLGWFGPVGVSAIFYLTLEAKEMAVPEAVLAAGTLVVVASTVAHGLTGSPGRVLYKRVTSDRSQPARAG
jgi:NhaP-type Na+/H+ or K+/H+ antiporter